MPAPTPVIDADDRDFDDKVLRRSATVPVVVDFWAAWCGPCRALGPILESAVEAMGGRVQLVKVDTDRSPTVAARYGIRSIPAVKAFRGGEIVDEFVGAQPMAEVKRFLDRIAPSPERELLASARAARERGDLDGAERLIAQLGKLSDMELRSERALLDAELRLARGKTGEVEAALADVDERSKVAWKADAIRQLLELAAIAEAYGGETKAQASLDGNADDLEARHALACALAVRGRLRDALEHLLAIVSRSRKFRDDAARRAMLTLFDQPGADPELVREFRRKLQIVT